MYLTGYGRLDVRGTPVGFWYKVDDKYLKRRPLIIKVRTIGLR